MLTWEVGNCQKQTYRGLKWIPNVHLLRVVEDHIKNTYRFSNFTVMAQELLSSNIDGLFEKMNLDEIQQVLRKMRIEVEKKREDLRVTVGYYNHLICLEYANTQVVFLFCYRSRYRDLIEAADTITEMKKTAEEVSEHLYSMEDKLGSLKHRQLLGFQTDIYSSEKQKYYFSLFVAFLT